MLSTLKLTSCFRAAPLRRFELRVRFPLAEARRAQRLLASGGMIGKIVLVPAGHPLT